MIYLTPFMTMKRVSGTYNQNCDELSDTAMREQEAARQALGEADDQ